MWSARTQFEPLQFRLVHLILIDSDVFTPFADSSLMVSCGVMLTPIAPPVTHRFVIDATWVLHCLYSIWTESMFSIYPKPNHKHLHRTFSVGNSHNFQPRTMLYVASGLKYGLVWSPVAGLILEDFIWFLSQSPWAYYIHCGMHCTHAWPS